MGVSNGQLANQTSFNNAFMARNNDTSTTGKVDLLNTEPESGASITNLQREHNAVQSYTGLPADSDIDVLPDWENDDIGTPTDNLMMRADALTERFNPTTGHTHNGSDAPLVSASDLDAVRLKGSFLRGVNLSGVTAVTGSSVDVSTQMASKTPSTGDSVKGVAVLPPNNRVLLRDYTPATSGDQLKDGLGNIVYGRITEASGVWTLSFYVDVAGVETAYSFTAQELAWYYQELFNPITDAPIYSELALVPSDNATQDVVDATTTQRGLVNTTAQSFAGVKTFADTTQSTTKDNGAVIIEGGLGVEKNANVGGNLGVAGTVSATGNITGGNLSGTNSGDISLGTFGTAPDAKGATLANQVLTLQPADLTHPGLVDILAQTWAGIKTFANGIVAKAFLALERLDVASTASIAQLASTKSFVKLTGSTATTIHGIAAGVDGQVITIHNGSTADLIIKHQSVTATAVDRLKLSSATDLTVSADSSAAFIYDTNQSRWVVYSGSGSGSASAGASASLKWIEGSAAPLVTVENGMEVYAFEKGLGQELLTVIGVPLSYVAGKKISARIPYYENDPAGGATEFFTTATLIRTTVDAVTTTANQVGGGGTISLGAGQQGKMLALTADLTDASGNINGVAVSPGDFIRVRLYRGATGTTFPLMVPIAGAGVSFNA